MTKEIAAEKPAGKRYGKTQIILSKKYADKRDLLNAILEDDVQYTLKEIDTAIEEFMKREVK